MWIFGIAETHLHEGFTENPKEWWNKSQNHSLLTLFWKIYKTPRKNTEADTDCRKGHVLKLPTLLVSFVNCPCTHASSTPPSRCSLSCLAVLGQSQAPLTQNQPFHTLLGSSSWLPHQEMIPWMSQMPIMVMRLLQYTFM